jgi:hypothetical protein
MKLTRSRTALAVRSALAISIALGTASAGANLVLNGGFESTTAAVTSNWGTGCPAPLTVSDWSTSSYGQGIVLPSWQPGAPGTGVLFPTGPCNAFSPVGVAGALPTSSPDGGNFVFSDADFGQAPIVQTINGLTPGVAYLLTFLQALIQDVQVGLTTPGAVSAHWDVTLGSSTQSSAGMTGNGSTNTFSNWAGQSMTFIPLSSTEVLSFLAVGTGDPPLILLDGVSLEQSVPEPASLALVLIGGLAAGATYRRTRWQGLRG